MSNCKKISFLSLSRFLVIGILLAVLHLFAPQSYAAQPVTGSWTFVGLSGQNVASVAVDPTNPNILYAGTEYNANVPGVFKSIDGGATWTAIDNGLPITQTHSSYDALAIDPSNPNVVYVGILGDAARDGLSYEGIFKSTDGGANWTVITPNNPNGDTHVTSVYDIAIDPSNTSTIYIAGAHSCNKVWKSTDGGASWTQTPIPFCDTLRVVLAPTNPNIIYALGEGGIYRSIDGASSWNQVFSNTDPILNGGSISTFALDTLSTNVLYAGTTSGIYKSTDSGATWTHQSGSPAVFVTHDLVTDPARTNTAYAGVNLTPAYQTTDAGATWNTISNGWPGQYIKTLLRPSNDPNVLYAGREGDTGGVYVYGLTSANQAPHINSLNGATINEGGTYSENGSFTDSDSTSWTATVDYGDGSGSQALSLSGMNFSLSHVYSTHGTYTVTVSVTDNQGATGTGTATVTVQRQLVTLSPAKIWVGLKTSDDVGVKFDLKAEVYKDSTLVTSGELDSVAAGSSGFNNAKLDTIPFDSFSPLDFPSGSQLSVKLYVRNACTGSPHNSGVARLWFNDSAADSHFDATLGTNTSNYYLLDNSVLATSAGAGPKKTSDVQAGARCSAFKSFGTWAITP